MDRGGSDLEIDEPAHSDDEAARSSTGMSLSGQQVQKRTAAAVGWTAPPALLQVSRNQLRFLGAKLPLQVVPDAGRNLFTFHS